MSSSRAFNPSQICGLNLDKSNFEGIEDMKVEFKPDINSTSNMFTACKDNFKPISDIIEKPGLTIDMNAIQSILDGMKIK